MIHQTSPDREEGIASQRKGPAGARTPETVCGTWRTVYGWSEGASRSGGREAGWYRVDKASPPFGRLQFLSAGRIGGPEEPTGDGVHLRNQLLLLTQPCVNLGLL